ncbi:hypothetical protein D3C86_2018590 [compost metagenome]
MGGEVTDRAAVTAATTAFGTRDELHRTHFWRAAQGAHIHAGAVGVQRIEIVAQLAHHAGNEVHHEGVAVNFG